MKELQDKLTEEKVLKYFDVTSRALKKVKIVKKGSINFENSAKDYLDMASRYFSDAKYFYDNKDYINAFAALNYAHGWLDAGARIGLFDVDGDNVLFTVDPKED